MVFIAPTSIEEKFYAVAEVLTVADQVIMSTSDVNKLFGELLVACSLLGKHVIFTTDNSIDMLLSGVKLSDFEFSERDELLQKIAAKKPSASRTGSPGRHRQGFQREGHRRGCSWDSDQGHCACARRAILWRPESDRKVDSEPGCRHT